MCALNSRTKKILFRENLNIYPFSEDNDEMKRKLKSDLSSVAPHYDESSEGKLGVGVRLTPNIRTPD